MPYKKYRLFAFEEKSTALKILERVIVKSGIGGDHKLEDSNRLLVTLSNAIKKNIAYNRFRGLSKKIKYELREAIANTIYKRISLIENVPLSGIINQKSPAGVMLLSYYDSAASSPSAYIAFPEGCMTEDLLTCDIQAVMKLEKFKDLAKLPASKSAETKAVPQCTIS